ncbi:MAG: hypothetical protein KKG76_07140, partial [Euryarchaeota archaeon]|nr:hypothetical protein [Euryarchaeota archaeon]
HAIVKSITQHGDPVFHTSEMHLKPFLCRESVCNLADIIAVYKRSEMFYIVGIEIKEWDKRVHQKIALEYLETYRHTCEYFYPDVELRANIMKRIKNNFKVLAHAVDDPFQRTILEF